MGSAFSFIKLIWGNCHWITAGFTTSYPESDETSIGEWRIPPAEIEEAGIRSTLPSGLIPLRADATLTRRNASCLLSERQQVDGCKSVSWILRCAWHTLQVMDFISASTQRRVVVSHRVQFGPGGNAPDGSNQSVPVL